MQITEKKERKKKYTRTEVHKRRKIDTNKNTYNFLSISYKENYFYTTVWDMRVWVL